MVGGKIRNGGTKTKKGGPDLRTALRVVTCYFCRFSTNFQPPAMEDMTPLPST